MTNSYSTSRLLAGVARIVDGCAGLRAHKAYRRTGLLAGRYADSHPDISDRWPRLTATIDAPATAITAEALRTLVGIGMCINAQDYRRQGLLAAVDIGVGRMLTARSNFGREGADDMMDTLSMLALLSAGERDAESAHTAYLKAVNVQLTLAYVMAGLAKIVSYEWNSGEAIRMVMSTESFGDPKLYSWLTDHREAGKFITRAVAVAELLYPLIYLVPNRHAARTLAIGGMGFHLFAAAKMSLPQFVYAFGAAYPAVFWAISRRHNAKRSVLR
ncbi:hypothetical protein GOEFS_094_00270 [Gordonia effusa NBRC 100432]|uniref:HTTM-like domain-containing protein n=1 Tax=Gordonia effusa NBRC 100432 TaxID=1077974 RepID=H0R3S7_9ACTN|nr:hypothetical protein [Gordonia effusa]GAB19728.1 hypothetical protein GOEFS_094_00270 [Gordonia effusa NBRC 100432]